MENPLILPPIPFAKRIGNTIHLSGHLALDDDMQPLRTNFADEVRRVFLNLTKTLQSEGGQLSDLLHLRVFLKDLRNYEQFNEVWKEVFPDLAMCPSRTTVGAELTEPFQIEIEGMAIVEPM